MNLGACSLNAKACIFLCCIFSDQTNFTVSQDQMHLRCDRQRNAWVRLVRELHNQTQCGKTGPAESESSERTPISDEKAMRTESPTIDISEDSLRESLPATDVPSIVFPCIRDALTWLSCGRDPNLRGELLTPPAFPPPPQLQEATHVQVSQTRI